MHSDFSQVMSDAWWCDMLHGTSSSYSQENSIGNLNSLKLWDFCEYLSSHLECFWQDWQLYIYYWVVRKLLVGKETVICQDTILDADMQWEALHISPGSNQPWHSRSLQCRRGGIHWRRKSTELEDLIGGFPGGSVVKNLRETWVWSLIW